MEDIIKFIKECKVFWVNTVSGNEPNSRPFGAISTDGKYLFIATSKLKNVYNEIINNPNIMISCLKAGTRDWLRINCNASVSNNRKDKELLFNDFPILYQRYNGLDDPNLIVFKLNVLKYSRY